MPKSVEEILADPRFNDFSPEDQQDIIVQATMATHLAKSKEKTLPPDKRSALDLARDWYNTGNGGQLPFLGKEPIGARINGALAGGMAGVPFGGVPGALGGAALGAAFPPHSAGDIMTQFAAGPIGEATAPMINAIGGGRMAKTGMAGLMGMLNSQLLNNTASATDMAAHAINPNMPEATNPNIYSAKDAVLQGGPTALMQALIPNAVNRNPTARSAQFAGQVLGPEAGQISKLDEVQSMLKGVPQLEKARQAGSALTPELQQNKNLTNKVLAELGEIKTNKNIVSERLAGIADKENMENSVLKAAKSQTKAEWNTLSPEEKKARIRYGYTPKQRDLNAEADLLRSRAEQAAFSPTNQRQYFSDTVNDIGSKTHLKSVEARLSTNEDLLNENLQKLKQEAATTYAMPEGLRKLSQGSENAFDLVQNLKKADPQTLMDYYKHLQGQPGGEKHVATVRNALVSQFFNDSYDNVNKAFTKTADLMKSGGPYSMDKLAAIYGGGEEGAKKAQLFQRAVNDISQFSEDQKLGGMAKYAVGHLAWIMPNILLFHPETMTKPETSVALASGAAASGLLGVGWNKLIDGLLKSPVLGDSFHKWATSTTRQGRSLANWPRLAAWLEQNGQRQSLEADRQKQAAQAAQEE